MALYAVGLMVFAMIVTLAMGILYPDFDCVSKNSFTRVDGIAVGAVLAVILHGGTPKLSAAARGALFAGSMAVILWVAHNFGLTHVPVALLPLVTGWPLAALACGGILLSVLGTTGRWTAPLRSGPFVYLGRISYGLYVYHELLLKVAARVFPEHDSSPAQMVGYWAFGLCTTLPIAALSYRFIELPFLRLKRRRFTVVPSRPD